MTNRTQDPDTTLAAWFDEGPTELPEAVRRSIATTVKTTTQERRGFGQLWRFPMNGWARYAVLAVTVVVIAVGGWYLLGSQRGGVGGPAESPSPTVAASASVSASTSAAPSAVTFTSPFYGYTVTLPPGWTATPASSAWDGNGAPGSEDPAVDKFHGPDLKTVHAFASPISVDLAAYSAQVIARNPQLHTECPPQPGSVESTTVASDPATFISWDCGILINLVVGVHGDQGYQFVFRDPRLDQASDVADRALFESILDTASFAP